jgi:thiopeptide-type bacteriocin biosynthesis protein
MWVSAYLYSNADLDAMILGILPGLLCELHRGRSYRGFFFVRHHAGGLHLRVRLWVDDANHHDRIRSAIQMRADGYFASIPPAPASATNEALLRYFAEREGTSLAAEVYKDRTMRFAPYTFDAARFGIENERAIETHFAQSSRLALDMLEAGISIGQRQGSVFAFAVLTCLDTVIRYQRPTRLGAWRAWGLADLGGERLERLYAAQFERHKEQLTATTARVASGLSEPDGVHLSTAEQRWLRSLRTMCSALAPGTDRDRVVDTCLHLFCNRLGLSLNREGYVRFLVENALCDSVNSCE